MHCKNSKNSQTKTPAKKGLVKATLAVATSLAITLSGNIAIADSGHSFTEYAPVVRVEPVFRNVTVREPQRICRPAVQYNHHQHRYDYGRNHNRNQNHNQHRNYSRHTPQRNDRTHRTRSHSNGEVFVAGVIGGAIGRELSRSVNGRPSTGATIAGAVIGSALASNAINNTQPGKNHSSRHSQRHFAPVEHRYNDSRHHSTVHHNRRDNAHGNRYSRGPHHNRQNCTTTIQTRTERRRDGFNVTYRYHGHRYQTRTRHHPGDQIAITVSVKPQKH